MDEIKLHERTGDASYRSPVQCLTEVARELEVNPSLANKCIVLLLKDDAECFNVHWRQAGCRASEIVAATTIAQRMAIDHMGY